jgi:hypothetical protein
VTSRLTLSAAARTWGKSRQTLYTDMKAGKLSVGRDERGMVYVDAAEMVRTYGEPATRRDGPPEETGQVHGEAPETVLQATEIKHLQPVLKVPRWAEFEPVRELAGST